MKNAIHLGYEIGSGADVRIPLNHMAIAGQTQMSGKTTTLEALIGRSGLRAVVFVTKRGEGSFTDARTINPYFREQADWVFVSSLLEAARHEKLKFERAWIIRASRGARTLADVQHNIKESLKTAKGMSADVYLTLDAYLDQVVPQISSVQWAKSVDLKPGINAVNMIGLSDEMQGLVIRSTLEWILEKEKDTVVVVPEAWKFIPQGRGTPVKLGAERFIRQAAGLKNFLWLDSQDIAGVDKIILKSVPVWVLGVQRESNEVKRTLDQIPANVKKPKAADVQTLGLGQFFACYGSEIHRVYVQPRWMRGPEAQKVAMGELRAEDAAHRVVLEDRTPAIIKKVSAPVVAAAPNPKEVEEPMDADTKALMKQMADMMKLMTRSQVGLVPTDTPRQSNEPVLPAGDLNSIYDYVRARLLDEPEVVKIAASRPELVVEEERSTLTLDASSLRGRVGKLIAAGWLDTPKKQGTIRAELKRTGSDVNSGNLSREVAYFVKIGLLTDESDGYQAVPGMKRSIVQKK